LQQVIFDSSFLIAVVENPTTWFEDIVDGVGKFQPVLPDCVRKELEAMASGKYKKSRVARMSLELASRFKSFPCGGASVDDEIVSASFSLDAFVATTDEELQRVLRSAHVKVISLRGGRVGFG
jgi:rRNA-processing protein FCF1